MCLETFKSGRHLNAECLHGKSIFIPCVKPKTMVALWITVLPKLTSLMYRKGWPTFLNENWLLSISTSITRDYIFDVVSAAEFHRPDSWTVPDRYQSILISAPQMQRSYIYLTPNGRLCLETEFHRIYIVSISAAIKAWHGIKTISKWHCHIYLT